MSSLFIALVIGTAAVITKATTLMRRGCTTGEQAHINNSLGEEVPYTDRRNQTGRT